MLITEEKILEISNHVSEDMMQEARPFTKDELIQVIDYWMSQHNQKNNELIALQSKIVIKMLEVINFVKGINVNE